MSRPRIGRAECMVERGFLIVLRKANRQFFSLYFTDKKESICDSAVALHRAVVCRDRVETFGERQLVRRAADRGCLVFKCPQ